MRPVLEQETEVNPRKKDGEYKNKLETCKEWARYNKKMLDLSAEGGAYAAITQTAPQTLQELVQKGIQKGQK
jgi:hypothetical protein